MNVHRLPVESSQRLSGHPFDFTVDVSRLSTNQDFIKNSHMVTVESCTPVFYSEFRSTFAADARHPSSLILAWDRPVSYVVNQPNALCHLQQYETQGLYGMTADSSYVSKKTLGVILQGDTLNMAGRIRFRLLQETPLGFVPCQAPQTNVVYGTNFAFMLVFWSHPKPEHPLSHDYYRVFLSVADRLSGTADDCLVPVSINTNNSMNTRDDTWMCVMETISLVKSSTVAPALLLSSDTFRTSSEYDGNVLAVLARTKVDHKAVYGQKLSIKLTTSDTIGVPVSVTLDSLRAVHLAIKTTDGLAPEALEPYTVCFVVYKAK